MTTQDSAFTRPPGTPAHLPGPVPAADGEEGPPAPSPAGEGAAAAVAPPPRVLGDPPLPDRLPRPGAGAVDTWLLRITPTAALRADLLDDGERERAARFRREEDRTRYVASHIGLRRLLGAYLGAAPAAVAFVREPCPLCAAPHGRPAVAGQAEEAGGLHFSLSHSGGFALVALAAAPVGADLEEVPRPNVVDNLESQLHPLEQQQLAALARPTARPRSPAAGPARRPTSRAPGPVWARTRPAPRSAPAPARNPFPAGSWPTSPSPPATPPPGPCAPADPPSTGGAGPDSRAVRRAGFVRGVRG
nr:4-phosphopantetheinyl transferase [Streptomyces sp. SCUT-3]